MRTVSKDRAMADGIVILGTVGIVGVVAIVSIALVYNRSLWFRGNSSEVEIQANEISQQAKPAVRSRD